MTFNDLVESRPTWAAFGAMGAFLIALATKGVLHIIVVIRRPVNGHHRGVVRVEIGRQSSDKIPASRPEILAVTEKQLEEIRRERK